MSIVTNHTFASSILIFITISNVMILSHLCVGTPSNYSGAIVFPDRIESMVSQRFGNTPRKFVANVNSCAIDNQTFCLEDKNYPLDIIQGILQRHGNEFSNVFSNDIIPIDNVMNRDNLEEIDLCDSYTDVLFPKTGKTKEGEDLYIFNTNEHKQGVRVGMCLGSGKQCKPIVSVPNGYRTECVQHHVYHELLSLSPNGQGVKETFSFPACCKCAAYRN
ncbi:protein spaetzle-like [Contarinia nasturtii]|uniref:protein spaetzle-like n=1 Tax=Contarinia nasturtii TaxID=265458 RepID=UPI0012D43DDD|nr:protein spaetzle-like [Contarinia nasturtii]